MDLIWAILRMQLARLMQSGISPNNMVQDSGLAGYESILNSAARPLWKISCPMIEGHRTTNFVYIKFRLYVSDLGNISVHIYYTNGF